MQHRRSEGQGTFTSARMENRRVREHREVDRDGQVLLRQATGVLGFRTARSRCPPGFRPPRCYPRAVPGVVKP